MYKLREPLGEFRTFRAACERAKRTLSSVANASIVYTSLYQAHDLTDNIFRKLFEKLNAELFGYCMNPVQQVLRDSKVQC
jgi:L1 cell adhesion molecule like protein